MALDVVPPGVLDWHFPRSVASVALMVRFAAEHGVDERTALAGTGLTGAILADPDAQIDAGLELAVVRNLVRTLGGEPAVGLQLGARYRVTTFGIFGFACVSSPTLWDAITLALRYLELSFTFCIPTVEQRPGETAGNLHDEGVPSDVRQFLVERDLTAMYVVMTDLLGDGLPLRRMEFKFDRPRYTDRFTEIFGVEPQFGRPANLFVFDPAELERPLPQSNSHTLSMCEAQCRDLVTRRRERTGIAHEVRDRLIRVSGAPAGIEEVAHALNVSVRTLRRRLSDAGTSYRDLLDEVRQALAEEMLGTTPLSVSDVAVRLGYAEASSFIYAFKRWTGTTPAAFQRGRRAEALGVRRLREGG
ncbi:AraC family transcriptional regulator [Aldersonia sp. NBC_00410]|uniref:AraC family transcriptional regulator n=1 Tax=Aldersonia sp. NBC_00410 TaxID=2975954 RepID=UPI0022576F10|nr:AraC family transcriptional regulator [Aldersonia sp. NBC_00410]MCX5045641.1 AraC family transcriptional regulator [Aldersonia sp. NBC_00410]